MIGRPALGDLADRHRDVTLRGELERVRQQVLEDLVAAASGRWRTPRGSAGVDVDVEGEVLAIPPRSGTCGSRRRAATANVISSASTVTVPDSIFDRSRMSLMSVSRSAPAE